MVLPGGHKLFFSGCPARWIDDETRGWIAAYSAWKTFGRTPVEMGLTSADNLDPRWYEAVPLIDAEMNRQHAERVKRPKKGGPRG